MAQPPLPRRRLAHLLDFNHVVDHPRRARPSIGSGTDNDVTLLPRLLHDRRRRGIVAAGVKIDLDILESLLNHLASAVES